MCNAKRWWFPRDDTTSVSNDAPSIETANRIWPTAQMLGSIPSSDTIESRGFIFKRGVLLMPSGRGALFHAFLTKQKNIIFAGQRGRIVIKEKRGKPRWNYSRQTRRVRIPLKRLSLNRELITWRFSILGGEGYRGLPCAYVCACALCAGVVR